MLAVDSDEINDPLAASSSLVSRLHLISSLGNSKRARGVISSVPQEPQQESDPLVCPIGKSGIIRRALIQAALPTRDDLNKPSNSHEISN